MSWRRIPHPCYGNYGGRNNEGKICCDPPIDKMDEEFLIHDEHLRVAKTKYDRYLADLALFNGLKEIEIKDIKIPIYGPLYLFGSLFIFGIVSKINKPKEMM